MRSAIKSSGEKMQRGFEFGAVGGHAYLAAIKSGSSSSTVSLRDRFGRTGFDSTTTSPGS